MREIYFRGKDLDGNWREGDLIWATLGQGQKPMILDAFDEIDIGNNLYDVDPDTVGQFTGLLDCEGREIYEGDLLEYKTWAETGERYLTMGEVRFLQGQFLVVGPKDIEVQGLFSVAHEPALSDVRVIGNIHDNPELLENTR